LQLAATKVPAAYFNVNHLPRISHIRVSVAELLFRLFEVWPSSLNFLSDVTDHLVHVPFNYSHQVCQRISSTIERIAREMLDVALTL
jgi:hypothetical protein